MAEFSEDEKMEIVQRLAQYEPPSAIVADLRTRGVSTDNRQVGSYDPTRPYFEAGDRWREIFEATRKRFTEELEIIPAANRAFRINLLQEAALKARAKGNSVLMAAMLKQIAEDTGGALTNRRELGIDGSLSEAMTPDEKRAHLAALLGQVATAPTSDRLQ